MAQLQDRLKAEPQKSNYPLDLFFHSLHGTSLQRDSAAGGLAPYPKNSNIAVIFNEKQSVTQQASRNDRTRQKRKFARRNIPK